MKLVEVVNERSLPMKGSSFVGGFDVRNGVYNKLIDNGNEEALSNPEEFHVQLDAHFNRLPARYGTYEKMNRVENILLHQKLLAQAKDQEKRPVFDVRFVERTDVVKEEWPGSEGLGEEQELEIGKDSHVTDGKTWSLKGLIKRTDVNIDDSRCPKDSTTTYVTKISGPTVKLFINLRDFPTIFECVKHLTFEVYGEKDETAVVVTFLDQTGAEIPIEAMGSIKWEDFSPMELYAYPHEFELPEGEPHLVKFLEMARNEEGDWQVVRWRLKDVSTIVEFEHMALWFLETFPSVEFVKWRHAEGEEFPITDSDIRRYRIWKIASRKVSLYLQRMHAV